MISNGILTVLGERKRGCGVWRVARATDFILYMKVL